MKQKLPSAARKLIIVFILLAMTLLLCMQSPLSPFSRAGSLGTDSNVFQYVAQEMRAGNMPYRDTFDHKGPLLYLINYFGSLILGSRGIWCIEFILMFVAICFAYKSARRFISSPAALIVTSVVFSLLYLFFEGGNFTEDCALPFQFIAVDLFLGFFKEHQYHFKPKEKQWFSLPFFIIGFCAAAVLMLRPNMIAVWLVFYPMLLLYCIKDKNLRMFWGAVASSAIGAVVLIAPILIWLMLSNAFTQFVDCYVLFNLQYSEGVSQLDRASVVLYFLEPVVVSLAFIVMIVKIYSQIHNKEKIAFNVGYLILMAVSLILIGLSARKYLHYGMTLLPVLVYPYCVLYDLSSTNKGNRNPASLLLSLWLIVTISLPVWTALANTTLQKVQDRRLPQYTDSLIEYVSDNTNSDDRISVIGNQDYIYVYTNRLSASKYSYQYPIAEISEQVREEYLSDITTNKPKIIIVGEGYKDSLSVLGEPLQELLAKSYKEVPGVSKSMVVYQKI